MSDAARAICFVVHETFTSAIYKVFPQRYTEKNDTTSYSLSDSKVVDGRPPSEDSKKYSQSF